MPLRAAFYVDGFNLYHGIDTLNKPELKWFSLMDYAKFIASQRGEQLVKVHYFSALAHHKPASVGRHQTYLRALKSTGVIYTLGKFKNKPRQCFKCGTKWTGHEEKETDVSIAVQMIEDAIDGLADVLYVLSADSDLAPAVRVLHRKFPSIEYVPVAPPKRPHPSELLQLSKRNLQVTEIAISKNRLPDQITDSAGTFVSPKEYAIKTKP